MSVEKILNDDFEDDNESSNDDDFEIEIVDDTPDEDKGKELLPDDHESKVPDDSELEEYSSKVQQRIKDLRFEYHDQRRKAEEADRQKEAAVQYARKVFDDNKKLKEEIETHKKTLVDGENVLIEQAKGRVEQGLKALRMAYKEAFDSGDADKLAEIQMMIGELSAEKNRVETYIPPTYTPREDTKEEFPEKIVNPEIPEPDPKSIRWQRNNIDWFNKDHEMTGYAFGLHQKLIVEDKVDPTSDEYYEKLDEGMRNKFPEYFKSGNGEEDPAPTKRSTVAPATRSGKSSRKIKLTKSQLDIARRLGVTPEQYAAQLVKGNQ